MLHRLFATLLATFLTLGTALILLWHLAFGVGTSTQEGVGLPALSAPVSIWQQPDGLFAVEATSEADTYAALGYLHGRTRTWPALLLRQVALGEVSAWFGDTLLDLDVFTRSLGLAAGAQTTYQQLPLADRAVLDAYSAGLETALRDPDTRLADELVLFKLNPRPWQPWHSLAVERLLAWLSTAPIDPALADSAGAGVRAFLAQDVRLRNWLHLHGFEQSTAWAVRQAEGTYLHWQQVYGATALPLFQEVTLTRPDDAALVLSVPGTPMLLMTQDARALQAYFLASPRRLGRQRYTPAAPRPAAHYDRATSNQGTERLVQTYRTADQLLLTPQPDGYQSQTDTTEAWVVHWPGFGPVSDWPQWRSRASAVTAGRAAPDTAQAFALFTPAGLHLQPDGQWRVLGRARYTLTLPTGVLISNSPWAGPQAARLRQLAQDSMPTPEAWTDDVMSTWAAGLTPRLLQVLPVALPPTMGLSDAVDYLQNWDYRYDEASIGASLFDAWIGRYETRYGAAFTRHHVPLDTLLAHADSAWVLQALEDAVAHLTQRFGADQGVWRWERTQLNRRAYPVWSDSTLQAQLPDLHGTRYAPAAITAGGHVSTPRYHPPGFAALPAPATWSAWGHTANWPTLTTRQDMKRSDQFMSQYLNTLRARPTAFDARTPQRGQRLVHLHP